MASKTDLTAVNTIRTLAADVVGKANSGHPGAPMGMAPAAHILWTRHMNFNSKNPKWFNRDRFVLSNGHACVLQYIMLHLSGYKVTMDDLKGFRQIDSITPGHPELGVTEGIEVTTGPLGQGISNAVGLAIAQAHMGAVFNKKDFPLVTNYTYAFMGDGCLQEGIASEACSLAGHLKLGNLIAIYDDNKITIDGDTAVSFTEDVEMRFRSYGWNVLRVEHGDDDFDGIEKAITEAQTSKDAPTVINLKTTIGYGSLLAGGHDIHGAPLKKDDLAQLKKKFGFNPDELFAVPAETYDLYRATAEKGAKKEAEWDELLKSYGEKYPKEAAELQRRIEGRLPDGWEQALPTYKVSDAAVGSRKLSENTLSKLVEAIPELVGGSADLTPSNLTRWKGAQDFQHPSTGLGTYAGRYFRFGVREHAMTAILNGIAAYGGLIPFGATFLNFVSYAAGAIRLSALSHLRILMVATHDSIGLGEDGPTHQPVETAAWLRAVPNLAFWRPADGNECSATYLIAIMSKHTPSVMAFSRQNLPQLANSSIAKATKGGYVLEEVENGQSFSDAKVALDDEATLADLTIVSTGSEVGLCIEAIKKLNEKDLKVRLVSMPCMEVFNAQDRDYKLSVLPSGAPVLSVEAYSTFGWGAYSHEHFGLKAWGSSGPYDKVYQKFEMTGEGIAKRAEKVAAFYKKRGQPVFSPLISALDDISD